MCVCACYAHMSYAKAEQSHSSHLGKIAPRETERESDKPQNRHTTLIGTVPWRVTGKQKIGLVEPVQNPNFPNKNSVTECGLAAEIADSSNGSAFKSELGQCDSYSVVSSKGSDRGPTRQKK